MKKTLFVMMIIFLFMVEGCSQKQVARPPDDQPAEQTLQPDKPDTKPRDTTETKIPRDTITERPGDRIKTSDSDAAVAEIQSKLKDIYFEFDKSDLSDTARNIAKEAAQLLSKNQNVRIIIEGHCDERGTTEYNLALGDRRARSVRDYLITLGVVSSRVDTVSYGEEKPVCTEHNDQCWAKNRRAHFVALKEIR